MRWPIGSGRQGIRLVAARDGAIVANGVAVTAARGWIELPVPPRAAARDGGPEVAVCLHLVLDASGTPFLYGGQMDVGGCRYGGLPALALHRGGWWITYVIPQVHVEIARRMDLGPCATAERHARAAPRPAARWLPAVAPREARVRPRACVAAFEVAPIESGAYPRPRL